MTSARHGALVALALLAVAACDEPASMTGGTDDAPPRYAPPSTPSASSSDRTLRFYYGPMKLMLGETILFSVAAFTGHDFGSWDFTAPDPATAAFADSGNGGDYYRHCRLLGGCMEHRIPLGRTSFVGTAYVLELERLVVEACNDRGAYGMFPNGEPPTDGTRTVDVIRHQYVGAFGEEPTESDLDLSLAYFDSHLADPELTDVSAIESAGRGHCRALLTTNRFLFY